MFIERIRQSPIQTLQALRAVAALAIVAYHIDGGINIYMGHEKGFSLFLWGREGVPIFFVLSGFVVALSLALRPRDPWIFLYSRFARLYPAYLFTAISFISLLALVPASIFRNPLPITLAGLSKTLFFEYGQISGYVYVGWVLFYEACFYILIAPFAHHFPLISKQSWFSMLIALGLTSTAIYQANLVSYFLSGVAAFLLCINPRDSQWNDPYRVILAAAVTINGIRVPSAMFAFILISSLFFIEMQSPLRTWRWPQSLQSLFNIFLQLGDASYSIYLAQVITISASLKISRFVVTSLPLQSNDYLQYLIFWLLSLVLGLSSSISFGLWMRRVIEIPSYRLMMRFSPHATSTRK